MQQTSKAAAPLRIFVVEDSTPIRDRLGAMITEAGAELAGHASTVAEAIPGILAARPALVILDMQLADGTGFDVLRAIRERAPDIDVYFFSNFAAYPYRDLAGRLGATGFFDKSREFDRIRDIVAQRAAASH